VARRPHRRPTEAHGACGRPQPFPDGSSTMMPRARKFSGDSREGLAASFAAGGGVCSGDPGGCFACGGGLICFVISIAPARASGGPWRVKALGKPLL
jgi:hypothetical protein